MATSDASDKMYEQLLAINQEAFEQGGYETAYHALAAALHRAQDIRSGPLLTRVQQVAIEQQKLLDTAVPIHSLSSHTATRLSADRIYSLLASQAATRRQVIEMEQRQKR